jgi:hypothetical protein
VLHAHDSPAVGFMRRYFDEYRGLRQTGHIKRVPTGIGMKSLEAAED